jgi:hypothetical protein
MSGIALRVSDQSKDARLCCSIAAVHVVPWRSALTVKAAGVIRVWADPSTSADGRTYCKSRELHASSACVVSTSRSAGRQNLGPTLVSQSKARALSRVDDRESDGLASIQETWNTKVIPQFDYDPLAVARLLCLPVTSRSAAYPNFGRTFFPTPAHIRNDYRSAGDSLHIAGLHDVYSQQRRRGLRSRYGRQELKTVRVRLA